MATPSARDRVLARDILDGIQDDLGDLEWIAGLIADEKDAQVEIACKVVCGMCRRGIGLEEDARPGWRHFDGDAFYRCEARDIRRVLAGAMSLDEIGR